LPASHPARIFFRVGVAALCLLAAGQALRGETGGVQPPASEAPQRIFVRQYRVSGSEVLPRIKVEKAVYPYLGPGRTVEDIDKARAALEEAYREAGYQAAVVDVPPQPFRGGVVVLQVLEGKVGRLRVKGSRYFDLERIKKQAPSLQEGKVVNFNDLTRDLLRLNQWPDRQVTPELKAGLEPGLVDIDLNVKDTFPLHGSVELNNRYSADTTELRLNAGISYSNLWQLGHGIGFNMQISPEDTEEVKVLSAYYLMRFPGVDWLTLQLLGVKQDSNVSTLGGAAVVGRGETIGGRLIFALPGKNGFFHSLSFGMDYKNYDDSQEFLGLTTVTPISYYPFSLNYTAGWAGKGYETELNAGVTWGLRGMGSRSVKFDDIRFRADGNYFYFRGDLAHTHRVGYGFELYGKVMTQLSNVPLITNEQMSGGGLESVRGYLEAEVQGDNGIAGTVELRSPSLLGFLGEGNELKLYVFGDVGQFTLVDALPEQDSSFQMASLGFGGEVKLINHLNAALDVAWPLVDQTTTRAYDPRLLFRVWADF